MQYSLQLLADQRFTPDVARELIGNVAHRLSIQTDACSKLLLERSPTSLSQRQLLQQRVTDNLRHLLYIHKDTLRQCQHVERHGVLFDRWSRADGHIVTATAEEVRSRHAASLERWVDIVQTSKDRRLEDDVIRILQRRLGIQLLCDHIVKLSQASRMHGNVSVQCDLSDVIQEAYTEAAAVCDAHLQVAPELDFDGDGTSLTVTVIRPWLYHALVELLKNAMYASVQKVIAQEGANSQHNNNITILDPLLSPPPITIQIQKDDANDSITIDVIDRGIGIPTTTDSSTTDLELLLFGLGQSSAIQRWDRLKEQQSYATVRSPLSSLGVGLPISRMMMQHFGGTLQVFPQELGCRARIRLPCNASILEPLSSVT
jgi:pyruvate dehydrogenase kinase 2/3/4